jgi:hypothetical protein
MLVCLEGRESPSALQPGDLLAAPLAAPLALTSVATADLGPQVPVSQPAANEVSAAPAGPLSDNVIPMAVSLANPVTVGTGPVNNQDPQRCLVGMVEEKVVHSKPPLIEDFLASEGQNGYWSFDGKVVADTSWGFVIHFGGLPSLQEQVVEAQSDGTFDFSIRLQSTDRGLATAQTTDCMGQNSNVATDWVDPTNGGR